MTGVTDHDIGHGGGAGAHDVNRVRFPGPDDCDPGEEYLPVRFVSRDDVADAVFQARARARAQGVAWLTVIVGIGMVIAGLVQHNAALFSSGVTAVVVAFIPRCRPVWAYEIARTWAIKRGWTAAPAEERPLQSDMEDPTFRRDRRTILGFLGYPTGSPDEGRPAKRAKPVIDVRRADEI